MQQDAAKAESEAVAMGELVLRAARLLEAGLAPSMSELGLNETRFCVLEALCRQSPEGFSQTELASRLFLSEANLSTLLERMRLDGLVTRERSIVDRRKSLVRLTPRGNEALAAANRRRAVAMSNLLETVSGGERLPMTGGLQELARALERRVADQRIGERPGSHPYGVVWPDGERLPAAPAASDRSAME